MEFVSFFMFIAWNALLTNLTFGKGESQTANHFLSFDSLMSTTLFIYLLYSLLLIQKELKLQQLAKTKSKIHIQHPAMIWTHIWKIKGYLVKIFNCFLFRKLYIRCKTTKNFGKFERLHWKWLHSHPSSLNNMHVLHYVMFNFPVFY